MEQEYHETTLTSEIPSSVFLSTQLVSDVKEIKFGWQESHAYSSSHRGISPFAVPHTPIEAHSALRALEEDSAAATTTTIADVRAARTGPPPCPTDYYTFLQMLCAYIKLLMMLFGSHCEHLAQVLQIYSIFQRRVGMFQSVTREQVGHLLWAVFIDARTYFSTHHDTMGNPPVSHLALMVSALQGGSLPGALGTPLSSMFRGTSDPPQARLGGQRDSRGNEESANGPPYVNNQVNAKIAEATANAIRCAPTVNFRKVLAVAASPKPQLSSLQLHRGGCFDYLFFGKCNSPRCTFQHTGEVMETKIDGVIAKMRAPLAKFVSESWNDGPQATMRAMHLPGRPDDSDAPRKLMPRKMAPAKQAAREEEERARAKAVTQTRHKQAYTDAVVQQLESVALAHSEKRAGPSAVDPVLAKDTPTQKAKGK
jgi:hypothetical protein